MPITEEKSILLIEDNPDDVELTIRALRANNISNAIVIASDGVEALDLLFEAGEDGPISDFRLPELILLDLKLPKIGGIDVLQRIRANRRTALVPVVVLTSSRQDQDLVASYRLGANSYIRKPVDFDKFVEAVRQLGLYWLVLNEAPPEPHSLL